MRKKIQNFSLVCLLILMSVTAFAQQNMYKFRAGPTVGATLYHGDLVDGILPKKVFNNARLAYGFNLEGSLTNGIGLRLTGTKGKFSYNEINNDNTFLADPINFETKFWDTGLDLLFYPEKGRAPFVPYIGIGFGVTRFDVFSDLQDADGNFYNYNDDDLEFDGDYETNLREQNAEGANYSDWAFNLPVTLGLKFKLGQRWNFNLETALKYSLSDYLDDVDVRGENDKLNDIYTYHSAALQYNFGFKKKSFTAPKVVVDKYSALSAEDTIVREISPKEQIEELAAEEAAMDTNGDGKVSRKERKAARKAAKAAKKAAKKGEKDKGDEQAKKGSKKDMKAAIKQAKADCKAYCAGLPKGEQKACKKKCRKPEGYAQFLKTEEEAIVSTDAPATPSTPEEAAQQRKLDSLQTVIEQEDKARDEKSLISVAPAPAPIIVNTPGTAPVPAPAPAPIIVNPPAAAPIPMPAPAPAPAPVAKGDTQTEIRAMLNERDIQDMKMQLEILKLKQEQAQANDKPQVFPPAISKEENTNEENDKKDAVLEMYKMETDRLRQENSDSKILGQLKRIQDRLDRMEQSMYSGTSTMQKEVIIEMDEDMDGKIKKEKRIIKKDGKDNEAMQQQIEELQEMIQKMQEAEEETGDEETEEGSIAPSEDGADTTATTEEPVEKKMKLM